MFNRAQAIHEKFKQRVAAGDLPQMAPNKLKTSLNSSEILDLFESQIMSRHLDLIARKLKARGECFYTIGSSGHEGNAVFGKAFRLTDMVFLHYRSGAFFIQRSKLRPGETPIYDLMLSLSASSEDPIAGGRHKVFGSKALMVPPQTSTIASHLPKAMGAALSIARADKLGIQSAMPGDGVVICNFGDASVNHSTAVGAINTACWVSHQHNPMPIIFICEDNSIGISTKTPEGWVEATYGNKSGLQYLQCDGRNILDSYEKAKLAEYYARDRQKPVFLHMKTVRLLGHAGSDVETVYHDMKHIEWTETRDPLLATAAIIRDQGILGLEEIGNLYSSVERQMEAVAEQAIKRPRLDLQKDVRETVVACTEKKQTPPVVSSQQRREVFGKDYEKRETPQHLAKLLNYALKDIMLQYGNTLVFGQDVAQKGGVYHVTDGLLKAFGRKRVFNSVLDEQSILGGAIGMAHNGFLPIPEIQFLAYVHNAEDQIRGEAATLSFFSQGQYTNPMVIRVAGLAYQKGFGGHFHNDNSLAVFRDIPGVVVAVPSNGRDAVLMLRRCVKEAYENGRVVVFVEPIARYMTRDLHEEGDKGWCFEYPDIKEVAELGQFKIWDEGKDLAIVTYGNGSYLSVQALGELKKKGIHGRVIDLQWIAPFDSASLADYLHNFKNILVVDECRKTGSFGEQIITGLVENMQSLPNIKFHAADDCFIPLGVAAAIGLPSKESITDAALELIGTKDDTQKRGGK